MAFPVQEVHPLDGRPCFSNCRQMGDFQSINWRSRGYLPHFDAIGSQQHIVIGLADAMPDTAVEAASASELLAFDRDLDAGHGDCLLRDPRCAAIVQDELLHHDGDRYRLLAWCVMPNHVHVVVEQRADLSGTVRRWKSWSARRINALLQRSGPLWRREYFDRFACSERQLGVMIEYVEANPVTAGLAPAAAEWPWSSAGYARCKAGQAPGGP